MRNQLPEHQVGNRLTQESPGKRPLYDDARQCRPHHFARQMWTAIALLWFRIKYCRYSKADSSIFPDRLFLVPMVKRVSVAHI